MLHDITYKHFFVTFFIFWFLTLFQCTQYNLLAAELLVIIINPTQIRNNRIFFIAIIAILIFAITFFISPAIIAPWLFILFLVLTLYCGTISSVAIYGYYLIWIAAFFHLSFITNTSISDVQHDFASCYNYFEYILENNFLFWHENPLLTRPSYSAYHPILHFFLAAIIIKTGSFFNSNITAVNEALQILFVSYMMWYGLIAQRILKFFSFSNIIFLSLLAFVVFFPEYNAISGFINNDCLLLPLQAGALYYALLYTDSGERKNLYYIWLFITAAALTKLSGILVLPAIASAFLYYFWKHRSKKVFTELFVSGSLIILGISIWTLYQHFYLHIGYDFVPPQLHLSLQQYSLWQRFSPLPMFTYQDLFYHNFGINLWETLTKTALFGEDDFSYRGHNILWLFPIFTHFYQIIIALVLLGFLYLCFKRKKTYLFIFSSILIFSLLTGIFLFSLKHPYMCNQDFRYIALLPLAFALLLGQAMQKLPSMIQKLICIFIISFTFIANFIWYWISF